jgi:hypothetical protein
MRLVANMRRNTGQRDSFWEWRNGTNQFRIESNVKATLDELGHSTGTAFKDASVRTS